jgi:hypothetical protein
LTTPPKEGKEMTMFFQACFCDNPCGHRHQTADAAERCAAETLRAAVAATAGKRPAFSHPADSAMLAGWAEDDPAQFVRQYHDSGLRVGG